MSKEIIIFRVERPEGIKGLDYMKHVSQIRAVFNRLTENDESNIMGIFIPEGIEVIHRQRVKPHDEQLINDINEMLIEHGLDVQIVKHDDMVLGAIHSPGRAESMREKSRADRILETEGSVLWMLTTLFGFSEDEAQDLARRRAEELA